MEDKILQPYKENKLRTATEIADALVNHAKYKSEQLLSEASRQASILVKEAEKSGLQKGQKKAFASLISGESLLKEVLEQSKTIILDVAIEVARELLLQELNSSPKSILPRVEYLLNKALNARKIKIYVNPTILKEISEKILTEYSNNSEIEIIGDQKLGFADIKVSTEIGEVSTVLENELSEISLSLMANSSKILR